MPPLALVVENDPGTQKLLEVLLGRYGFTADLAANGADALTLLRNVPYSLVILDLLLPEVSGFEILKEMAGQAGGPQVIVLSSALPSRLQEVQHLHPNVQALRKPFELAELAAAIDPASRHKIEPLAFPHQFCRRSMFLGARAGFAARKEGNELLLATSFGYGDADRWFPMSLDEAIPICTAVRDNKPLWISRLYVVVDDYPVLEPVWSRTRSQALAAVPVTQDDEIVGAIGWSFREPRHFNEPEKTAFLAIADAAAGELSSHAG